MNWDTYKGVLRDPEGYRMYVRNVLVGVIARDFEAGGSGVDSDELWNAVGHSARAELHALVAAGVIEAAGASRSWYRLTDRSERALVRMRSR